MRAEMDSEVARQLHAPIKQAKYRDHVAR